MSLDIRPFEERDDAEALDLERSLSQGGGFRLSFRRSRFARRAENFDEHEILVARRGGRLVGTIAIAFKDMLAHGRPTRGAYTFDLRVHPDQQRQGVASQLSAAAVDLVQGRAELGYSYVPEELVPAAELAGRIGQAQPGGYQVLVAPTSVEGEAGATVRPVDLSTVHESNLACRPPFDLYTDPRVGGRLDGHVGSWLVEEDDEIAGCSAWDNREIMAEVVEHLPAGLSTLARFSSWGPVAQLHLPHLPQPGERLRSWTLFDVHASGPVIARAMLHQVLNEARQADIDVCTFLLGLGDPLLDTLKAELPVLFSAVRPYRLYASHGERAALGLRRVYVDIRDV